MVRVGENVSASSSLLGIFTWSVMGGRWDALVGGSDAPGSADDGGVFSGRSLALCSELVHGRPPAAGCSRAGGSSEGAAFLGTSFVSDLSDFSKTDAFSDTSLLSAADGLPGAGGFSGTGGSEAAGFPETPFSLPPGSLAATLSSSLAWVPPQPESALHKAQRFHVLVIL